MGGFEKIEFVVTTAQDPYPQDIKFELLKEKIELLDAYSVDQRVLVSFNIRGNEWQGRHFVNLQAWRLQSLSSPATASPSSSFGGATKQTGSNDSCSSAKRAPHRDRCGC